MTALIYTDWGLRLLEALGLESPSGAMVAWTAALLLIFVALAIYFLLAGPVARIVNRYVAKTETQVDNLLFPPRTIHAICCIVALTFLFMEMPECFVQVPKQSQIVRLIIKVLLTIWIVYLINLLIIGFYMMLESREGASESVKSLKGIRQLFQTLAICIGIIVVVAFIINRSPLVVLSGLGASAALLMLVFRDTITGLMAGIRLTTNGMLKVGDWITMEKRNVNGIVSEVCLTTVKIENFDMTTVTVPPSALLQESFLNWQGMRGKGARRIQRSFCVDINSIRMLRGHDLDPYRSEPWAARLLRHEAEEGGHGIVNLTLFRHWLMHYVSSQPTFVVDDEQRIYCMIRELEPTSTGVPVQIYLFTTTTDWPGYERVQAGLMEHIFAMVGHFRLRLYQAPSGLDFRPVTIAGEGVFLNRTDAADTDIR